RAILVLQSRFASANKLSVRKSDDVFVQAFNARLISVDDWVLRQITRICARSLRNWRALENSNPARLAQKRGPAEGRDSILATANEGAVADLIAGALVRQPHLTARHARALVVATFGATLDVADDNGVLTPQQMPQERAFRAYISNWKAANKMALAKITDPDKFKSAYRVSGFSRHGNVERLNQVWESDASPADVLCSDGRHTIYVLVDVFSRRMITLVSRTPRAEAVMLLCRKAILAWGVPDTVKTDNGSDFVAHHIRRAFASLSINHELCDPFSPEQKGIVERSIGTLQRDLMPLLPGFIGHSVADRKAIEARKSFATRLGQDDDKAFAVEMSASELQVYADRWCDADYGRRAHTALPQKMSPFARAQSYKGPLKRVADVRALDMLLALVPGSDGIRTVGKQGLKIDNAFFTALTLMPGEKVLVRHDPADMGRVYCFKADGTEFLCEAICYERAGINPAEAIAKARAEQARIIKEQVDPLRKAAKKIKPRDMIEAILSAAERQAQNVVAFPRASETHTTPQMDAAGEAATPERKTRGPQLTPEQKRHVDKMRAEFESQPENNGDAAEPVVDADSKRRAFEAGFFADRAPAHTSSAKHARIVDMPETPKHRFRRAYLLEMTLFHLDPDGRRTPEECGLAIEDVLWLGRYQSLPEYQGQKTMFEDFGVEWLFDGLKT
ncbi:MAG: Mu transposase C-terminal domain-containing protein, partial [Hyphomicrobium sp.]